MTNLRSLALLLMLLLAVPQCPAQVAKGKHDAQQRQATIEFPPIQLALGMPKARVLTALAEHYDVSLFTEFGGDGWGVSEESEPHLLIGSVHFSGNMLVSASIEWQNSNTAFSAMHITADLLARLRDEGFSQCSVSARKEPYPELERDVIEINCGRKSIGITADRSTKVGQESETVYIYEAIDSAPAAGQH